MRVAARRPTGRARARRPPRPRPPPFGAPPGGPPPPARPRPPPAAARGGGAVSRLGHDRDHVAAHAPEQPHDAQLKLLLVGPTRAVPPGRLAPPLARARDERALRDVALRALGGRRGVGGDGEVRVHAWEHGPEPLAHPPLELRRVEPPLECADRRVGEGRVCVPHLERRADERHQLGAVHVGRNVPERRAEQQLERRREELVLEPLRAVRQRAEEARERRVAPLGVHVSGCCGLVDIHRVAVGRPVGRRRGRTLVEVAAALARDDHVAHELVEAGGVRVPRRLCEELDEDLVRPRYEQLRLDCGQQRAAEVGEREEEHDVLWVAHRRLRRYAQQPRRIGLVSAFGVAHARRCVRWRVRWRARWRACKLVCSRVGVLGVGDLERRQVEPREHAHDGAEHVAEDRAACREPALGVVGSAVGGARLGLAVLGAVLALAHLTLEAARRGERRVEQRLPQPRDVLARGEAGAELVDRDEERGEDEAAEKGLARRTAPRVQSAEELGERGGRPPPPGMRELAEVRGEQREQLRERLDRVLVDGVHLPTARVLGACGRGSGTITPRACGNSSANESMKYGSSPMRRANARCANSEWRSASALKYVRE